LYKLTQRHSIVAIKIYEIKKHSVLQFVHRLVLKIQQFVNYLHDVVYHVWCVRPAIVPIIRDYFYCCLNAIISPILPAWKHGHVQINCFPALFISATVFILVLVR